MAEYSWMDDLTSYKQNLDTVLVTGRESYDVVVRGTQLLNMASEALGTLDSLESQMSDALELFDQAGAALESVTGYINFALQYLDTVVAEITSLVESMVQEIIDAAFEAMEELYDAVLDSINEALGVDVEALLALAPVAGSLFEQALSLLPADITGDVGDQLSELRQYLDICAAFGSFKTITNTLAVQEVMGQVNEILAYVDINTWIPSAAKGVLSSRFTGFKTRTYIDDNGITDHKKLLTEKIGLNDSQADSIKNLIIQNENGFADLTFGMDPRCQGCSVDNSSEFTTW
jgi:hypothetical protein